MYLENLLKCERNGRINSKISILKTLEKETQCRWLIIGRRSLECGGWSILDGVRCRLGWSGWWS